MFIIFPFTIDILLAPSPLVVQKFHRFCAPWNHQNCANESIQRALSGGYTRPPKTLCGKWNNYLTIRTSFRRFGGVIRIYIFRICSSEFPPNPLVSHRISIEVRIPFALKSDPKIENQKVYDFLTPPKITALFFLWFGSAYRYFIPVVVFLRCGLSSQGRPTEKRMSSS